MPKFEKLIYQGVPGSFSFMAAKKYARATMPQAELRAVKTFEDIFQTVNAKPKNLGIVPLENSLAGSVLSNYDLLERHEVSIIGEVYLEVNHCLLSNAESLEAVEYVFSHPQALQQCSKYIESKGYQTRIAENTAVAAKSISDLTEKNGGAIASEACSELYQLPILARNIQNYSTNMTRFAVISGTKEQWKPGPGMKCSTLIRAAHEPGSLFKTVGVLAANDCNLTKLESRPVPDEPFTYTFYIDFECPDFEKALRALEESVPYVKILGCFPINTY